jgi:hypothetical protein
MNIHLGLSLLFILFSLSFSEYTILDGSKLIPISYAPNEDYDASEIVTPSAVSQEMLSYYSWFASYGYCEDVDVPLFCCKDFINFFTEKWTIVSESSITDFFDFNFVLWRNDEYKKYIFAFPGTRNDIIELLNEAVNIKLVDYNDEDNGIKLVNYFYKVTKEIREILFTPETFKDFEAHPGYQFIFTGHSLGASVAADILYDAINRNYFSASDTNPALIAFGMPRTGNEEWVIDFNSKVKNVLRVVRDGDIVASLPYLPINNPYTHLGGLILVNKELTSMYYCPKDIGEDYPDKVCVRTKSLDIKYHTYYFNPDTKFSSRCY